MSALPVEPVAAKLARSRACHQRYNHSIKGWERNRRYEESWKGHERKRRYELEVRPGSRSSKVPGAYQLESNGNRRWTNHGTVDERRQWTTYLRETRRGA